MGFKIFKETPELELQDITKKWKISKVLKWTLGVLSTVLLISTMTLYWNPVVKIKSLFVTDTVQKSSIDTNYVKFLAYSYFFINENKKLNDTNFLQFCKYIGLTHPYETTAQHIFETGNFNLSTSSAKYNNTGGFMTSKGYKKFKHWVDCIYFTKNFQKQHGLKKGMNYYTWLNGINYHEADKAIYNSAVRGIEEDLRRRFK